MVGDAATDYPGEVLGGLVQRDRLRAGHVVGASVVTLAYQYRDSHLRDVVARHRPYPPVACGPADDAIGAGQRGEVVQVHVVAREGVADAGRTHVLLSVPVVPGKREGGFRRGSHKGQVHDPLYAYLDGRV